MSNKKNDEITHATVRMYCMGTGDCFIVKFFAGDIEKFKMMIDCGVWQGTSERLKPFMENLKDYVQGSVDLLVVTHEHVDHVSVFETCKEIFTKDFEVKKIWMAWTENDDLSKIKKWKTEYGQKKKALAIAAEKIEKSLTDPSKKQEILNAGKGNNILAAKQGFADTLKNLADLQVQAVNGSYVGLLEGMRIVKKEIANDNIEYYFPGDIIEDVPALAGVKFYVLGPPKEWTDIKTEAGGKGESYSHNKELKGMDAFAASVLSSADNVDSILPFDEQYEAVTASTKDAYEAADESWRKIDDDWLFSAGSLALRINSMTNNLSLALAIEFDESKRVMLFPGDAEYGSWASWHEIEWKGIAPVTKGNHFTKDLLDRTVFYKIAHHMSHNGTAQRLGLEMMNHKDLAAMATLDYEVIAKNWKNTMPNRAMLQELLKRTKGRVMIMNENNLFFDFDEKEPLSDKIKDARKKMSKKERDLFEESFKVHKDRLYIEYNVLA